MITIGPSLQALANAARAASHEEELAPMTHCAQTLRMPVQLMRSEAEGTQGSAVDGMAGHAGDPYGPPAAIRTRIPHPWGHKVQNDCFISTGPRAGWGIHPQFWLQMETSSSSFHGTGVTSRPAVAGRAPQQISSCELHASPLLMATEAADLNVVPAMAVFTVAHLHALVRRPSHARDRVPPDIAAIPADPVLRINSHLVRLAIRRVAFVQARLARFT